jgi:hypothetical protein
VTTSPPYLIAWYAFSSHTPRSRYFSENASAFAVLGGVLRLSAKYDVPYFKRRAYENLAPLFPTTLAAWDKLYFDKPHILTDPTWSFAVVQLFRDTGLSALLPAALYAACFTSGGLDDILDGVLRDDGSRDELSEEDKNVCIKARETLLFTQRELIPGSLLIQTTCETRDKCNYARLLSLRDLVDTEAAHGPRHTFCPSGFESLTAFRSLACPPCRRSVDASWERIRQKIWEDLPGFFGLPNWPELLRSSEM